MEWVNLDTHLHEYVSLPLTKPILLTPLCCSTIVPNWFCCPCTKL